MDSEQNNENQITRNPLVSIVVITYNSSKYVLETLESAKSQTYQNIELIVSDDCSTDGTVEICRNWIEENKNRFVRTKLITSAINTGIPGNCNRGFRSAQGDWIKGTAGDDILMSRCIELNIEHIKNGDRVLFSNMQTFIIKNGEKHLQEILPRKEDLQFFALSATDQYKFFLNKSFNIAPTEFIKRDSYTNFGGFDERFKCFEDLPFYLDLTKSGYRLTHFNEVTVMYRRGEGVTSQNKTLIHADLRRSVLDFERIILFRAMPWYNIRFFIGHYYNLIDYYIAFYLFKNRRSRFAFVFMKVVNHTNPVELILSLYNRLIRGYLILKKVILKIPN